MTWGIAENPDGTRQAGGRYEIQVERDVAIPLTADDYRGVVLRVRYRERGVRRWTRFLLVPDPGETLDALQRKVVPAVEAHAIRVTP